ncbi:MAG: hypothetical protein ACFFCH_02340 [Promethearchaeota archaeon]
MFSDVNGLSLKRKSPLLSFLFISLLVSVSTFLPITAADSVETNSKPMSPNQVRNYHLMVVSRYDNLSSSYWGVVELILNSTATHFYLGSLTWNLTWDEGTTWTTNYASYTYSLNRSYQFAGLTLYTAWWVLPGLQLGDQIRIDGDAPVTNNFLRTAPFTVTDLVSLHINEAYYLCWQLTYFSNQLQSETYYYEFHTGILISATSLLFGGSRPVHEAHLWLSSSSPSLPQIHILFHYWINYQSIILAFLGATLVTVLFYYLIQYFLPTHRKPPISAPMSQNA